MLIFKDDYINASHLRNIGPSGYPDMIVTQLPMKGLAGQLLNLVWQEGIETMASLVGVADMTDGGYVPEGKGSLDIGDFTVTVQSMKVGVPYYIINHT